jgi:uncharacterized protein
MAYVDGFTVLDADSHVMELPGWLDAHADEATKAALRPLHLGGAGVFAEQAVAEADLRRQRGETLAADIDPLQVLQDKGWSAHGAFDGAERSRVLDALGFHAQLVFPTFAATQFAGDDLELLFGGADALNRAMAAFCADDPRLMAVGFVPWAEPERTITAARRAIEAGCRAIQLPSSMPRGVVGPTHPDHDPLWALLEERNVPAVTHIGGGGNPVQPNMHDNARPVTDFLGGGENVRSKDFLAVHQRTEVFWGALVLDGVFERFPGLRGASIEEGAMWVAPWIRRLDMAIRSFGKTEPTLRELPMSPSDYVHRQFRVCPFPGEPVDWLVESCGDDLFMFSSDYPHPEGTRDPVARFESSMTALGEASRRRFYSENFAELFRGAVAA